MKPLHVHLSQFGVLALGLGIWHFAGKSLQEAGQYEREPNVLCLKGSPFGKTIAMAMQGPVDVYWHEGEAHDHDHGPSESCSECDGNHDHASASPLAVNTEGSSAVAISTGGHDHEACANGECDHLEHAAGGHHHAPGEACAGCQLEDIDTVVTSVTSKGSIRTMLLEQIQDWRAVKNTRHNPLANSEAHKYFIRREVEKKLMLTYSMDPTNYASYGAYFLFLSESALSDREQSVKQAIRLSQATVEACIREQNSASALLTGAAASHDMGQMLIRNGGEKAGAYANQYFNATEEFLNGFEQVALQMAFDGTWEQFSENRRGEMSERARLLRKLLEADRKNPGINADNQEGEDAVSAG